MEKISTKIKGVSGPSIDFLVAALMKICCPLGNFKEFLEINQTGIKNANFINFVNAELQQLTNFGSVSKETIQTMYAVEFCEVRVRGSTISFIDQACWGDQIIYFENKKE